MSHFIDTLATDALLKGGIPTVLGVSLSLINEIEQWMRITSIGIGIAIGSLVLYSKICSMMKK